MSGQAEGATAPADPAMGFSLQVDLGAGRVATLQTFLPNTCSQVELNRMLDKMTAAGDRQRAHYRIEELDREIEREQRIYDQHKQDLANIDATFEVRLKSTEAAIESATKNLGAFDQARMTEAQNRGQREVGELKGAEKANRAKLANAIEQLVEQVGKQRAEYELTHKNSGVTLQRQEALLTKMKAEVADCRKLVAAGLVEAAPAAPAPD